MFGKFNIFDVRHRLVLQGEHARIFHLPALLVPVVIEQDAEEKFHQARPEQELTFGGSIAVYNPHFGLIKPPCDFLY